MAENVVTGGSLEIGRNYSGNVSGILRIEEDELAFDTGISSFMLLATAMVQLMTPGVALFYGGMVGAESVLGVMFQSFICMGVVFLLWVFVAFSLTFGDPWITIGGTNFLGSPWTFFLFNGVDVYQPLQKADAVLSSGFPGILFATFQGMFAVISPAIISGAFAGRLHTFTFALFACLWIVLVYAPMGYWNWGGGWMFQIGAWDFAGGIVVHETAGFSAMAAVLFLGNRVSHHKDHHVKTPHNVPMVALGTAVLWFGWIGFNCGSALTIGGLAGIAFCNTITAPSASMTVWVILERLFMRKASLIGACSGALAGLVAITPSAGFVQPSFSILIGVLGAVVCFFAVQLVEHLGLDDAVDAFAVHGLGGLCGTILVGVFSDPDVCLDEKTSPVWCANPGTVARSLTQTGIQALCGISAGVYSALVTVLLLYAMRLVGLAPILQRSAEQATTKDIHQHGQHAYFHPELDLGLQKEGKEVEASDSSAVEEEESQSISMSGAQSSSVRAMMRWW
eukprot:TRINITY_DN36144_c0_g1_i3.p1 TRINITY_DN36144_c0_g1~~TRINITY_DN36144_c0_g1_i3.p1  ORF type:complete len:518 (-),score=82.18 TRINITY_DN36144_c0_g1_i3:33-1559(-)